MDELKKLAEKIKTFEEKKHIQKSKHEINGSSICIEFISHIGVGIFIGYKMDQYFDTYPWFLLILLILGLISSIYTIYRKYK